MAAVVLNYYWCCGGCLIGKLFVSSPKHHYIPNAVFITRKLARCLVLTLQRSYKLKVSNSLSTASSYRIQVAQQSTHFLWPSTHILSLLSLFRPSNGPSQTKTSLSHSKPSTKAAFLSANLRKCSFASWNWRSGPSAWSLCLSDVSRDSRSLIDLFCLSSIVR